MTKIYTIKPGQENFNVEDKTIISTEAKDVIEEQTIAQIKQEIKQLKESIDQQKIRRANLILALQKIKTDLSLPVDIPE